MAAPAKSDDDKVKAKVAANAAANDDAVAKKKAAAAVDAKVAKAKDANAKDAKKEDAKKDEAKDDEDMGGLEDDDEQLTLTSGGKVAKKYEINKKDAELSKFVTTILEGDSDAKSIEIRQVPAETLKHVIDYLKHHKGKEPEPLPCPVRSIHMSQICGDKWDATWIDAFDKKTIFEIILAANYMDIKSLLHLGCAKIATLIKQLDQKEINRIIEEEEKYRREHAQSNDDAKTEEKKENNKK